MKRLLLFAAMIALAGCTMLQRHKNENPYVRSPFYAQWVNTGSPLDVQIRNTLDALRANPHSAPLHNQLGQLLVQKGFPRDAEVEFERAVNDDSRFFQGWYNLGLIRAAHDDYSGAERAFRHTVRLAKGHSEALWQLGLIEEKRGNEDDAVDYYAKAVRHNPAILDVRVNPRVLDTKLIYLVLLRNYELEHARQTSRFLGTPAGYVPSQTTQQQTLSPQATPQQIVTPSAPVTDPAKQATPPKTTT